MEISESNCLVDLVEFVVRLSHTNSVESVDLWLNKGSAYGRITCDGMNLFLSCKETGHIKVRTPKEAGNVQ